MRWMLLPILFAVVFLLGSPPNAVSAAAPNTTFTLQPTGKATITFYAFCTEFGDLYPNQIVAPYDRGTPQVQAALQYIADNGLVRDTNRALQGQFAIWLLLNQPGPSGDALTQQVVSFAQSNQVTDPQARSILDASRDKQVRLSLRRWEPASDKVQITATARDHFYGRGQLVVENISQQPLTLYMPIGTLFHPTVQSHQTMAGFLSDVTVSNPTLPNTSGNYQLLVIAGLLAAAIFPVRRMIAARGRRIA
jgi:hypothetical protein